MPMKNNISHLDRALRLVFTPLCRLLIRGGVPVRHVIAVLKQSYIDAAEAEACRRNGRVSTSEISRLTGITRQEVSRFRNAPRQSVPRELDYPVRDAAVLSTWSKNTRYIDGKGAPVPLPMRGEGPCFVELVERSYPEADAEVIASRFEERGNVVVGDDGRLSLVRKGVQINNNLPQLILDVLAAPATTLIANTQPDPSKAFCQRIAFIARPSADQIGTCRMQMRNRIKSFINDTDQHLVALTATDSMTETTSDQGGAGKIGVGAFYFELED